MLIILWLLILYCINLSSIEGHVAEDFDDTLLYKIEFDVPDLENFPNYKDFLKTFYTHEKEKYECLTFKRTPEESEIKTKNSNLSPFALLKVFSDSHSCSYRIESYWSYEICHGRHVRQYHEEREGKSVKLQEYYLGKWSQEDSQKLQQEWEEDRNAGIPYKTTRIDNINYPYFEMIMSGGTDCDITYSTRTTVIRYVCYPNSKNVIYSFKETSSCNYEAIILTSALCSIRAFHPEETKISYIKCFNSLTAPRKPLSMLRQELNDLQMSHDDFPIQKESNTAAATLSKSSSIGQRYVFLNKFTHNVDKLYINMISNLYGVDLQEIGNAKALTNRKSTSIVSDVSLFLEFFSGRKCLTGGTGWWKYEFCYGKYVRQFHKDIKGETELYLGYFYAYAHRQWLSLNPEKRHQRASTIIWHHYEKGTICDQTGLSRQIDVKLTCSSSSSSSAISMYLLEPKTCQYILVFESPMVCEIMKYVDEYGMIYKDGLEKFKQATNTFQSSSTQNPIDSNNMQTTPLELTEEQNLNNIPPSIPQEDENRL